MNKILPSFFAVLSLLISSFSPAASSPPTNRLACVGDSITFGGGSQHPPSESYPVQLASMLGSDWEVKNFGKSGRTLLNHGDHPYQKEKVLTDALAFNPTVVTIMLGTNDTKPQNWAFKDEFIADYKALIAKFKSLPSHPHIFICLPTIVCGNGRFGIVESGVDAEIPMLKQIAKEEGVDIIDTHSTLMGHEGVLHDRVHPDAEGYTLIAKTIYKAITGSDYSPRP